ncbi:MAG TPA: response regulator [Elusimicrobiota bacterium]|nr:response regulator [Elusimicrobiota bacterium]
MYRPRVLIVEDHKENAEAIASFIRFAYPDWELEICDRGAEAVSRSLENPADVVVLDIALADDTNGLEVVKGLWDGGLRQKPKIIFATALGNRAFRGPRVGRPWVEQLNEPERNMISAFFEKPYSWHAFLTALAKAAGVPPSDKIQLIPDDE